MDICIVTGSSGLVGSEAVKFFCNKGYLVIGIDNDMRKYFFGTSTSMLTDELKNKFKEKYIHYSIDIRDQFALEEIFKKYNTTIKCIIHCAAQPSHDWAAKEPHTDFQINAVGTLNLLECARKFCSSTNFIYMSTNKVYGDTPNKLNITERQFRYEVENLKNGIDETMSIDNCKHSIFGVSKLSADLMVQEYGRYFNMNTVVFRGGCITGPNHQGAELHGFLSYIIKCIMDDKPYTIYGYKGKQVRDNIHSADLVNAFWNYHQNPKSGAIYNIGGGRDNSISILELIQKVNSFLKKNWNNYKIVDENRSGDHIWYITDNGKFMQDYPNWKINYSLDYIIRDIISSNVQTVLTVGFRGGLGNQLFQIACAYSFSKKFKLKLQFIKNQHSGFDATGQGSFPVKYYDTLFSKLDLVSNIQITNTAIETVKDNNDDNSLVKRINDAVEKKPGLIVLDGFFQRFSLFKNYFAEIKELFTPAIGILNYISNSTTIFQTFPELKNDNDFGFIGIRRGDYITHSHVFNPCGMTYYNAGMKLLDKKKYYILTDDFTWAKQNFCGNQFRFLEFKDDLHQFLAITLFKSYIISNSTFYWWGSLLSIYSNPRVIAPDKWGAFVSDDIYRDDMEIIERPIETF